jgi:lactoylglutathione lyase
LWGASTGYGRQNGTFLPCHLEFAVSREQLTLALEPLTARGIETRGFDGQPCREPGVIGWMPSAPIHFREPEGHSLEFITILPHSPNPGIIGRIPNGKS